MGTGAGTAAGTSEVWGASAGTTTHDATFSPGLDLYSASKEAMVRTFDATVASGLGLYGGALATGEFPVHEKNYEFAVNRALDTGGSSLSLHQDAMLYMKNTMKGWSSNPWTVTQSCGLTGLDPNDPDDYTWGPNDYWTGTGTLHWGFPYLSWIVLQAPVGNMQILILLNLSPHDCVMIISPEGLFTAGTGPHGNDDRPVAVDEHWVYGYGFGAQSQHNWLHARNFVYPGQIHMIHADDGEMDMFICCANGIVSGHWIFWKSQETASGWGAPYSFFTTDCTDSSEGLSYTTGIAYPENLYAWAISKKAYTGDAGLSFRHTLSMEGSRLGTGSTYPVGRLWAGANAISGAYPMGEISAVSYQNLSASGAYYRNVGLRAGRLGRVPDLYATATSLSTGDTLEANPATPTQEWAVMGDVAVPWDGSTPVVS